MPQSRIPYSAANCLDEFPTLRAPSLTGPDAMFVHSMRPWKKAYASTRKSLYVIIFDAIDTHQQAHRSPHAGFERRRSRKECVLAAQLMPADEEFSGEDHASTRSRWEFSTVDFGCAHAGPGAGYGRRAFRMVQIRRNTGHQALRPPKRLELISGTRGEGAGKRICFDVSTFTDGRTTVRQERRERQQPN